jgi:hypothetical protein
VTWVPPRNASGVATSRNARMPKPTGRMCMQILTERRRGLFPL